MLKMNEIVQVEPGVALSGKLESEILICLQFEQSSKIYFLQTELTKAGREALTQLSGLIKEGCEIRILCRDEHRQALELFFAQTSANSQKMTTFKTRSEWRYDSSKKSLKALVDSKIRVLIVDDSKTIRNLLEKIISADAGFEVVGSIEDPRLVATELVRLKPDVMTLDIHMPGMTGVDVLRKIMPVTPVPTVMITSVGLQDGREVLTALELGAVDYIQKPSFQELSAVAPILLEKLKIASGVRMRSRHIRARQSTANPVAFSDLSYDRRKVICIGSSTGGTEAIRAIFRSMPKQFPPILITQHIPALFSLAFAESLRREFGFKVFEATDGQEVLPNQVLIAPGGTQMELMLKNGVLKVRVFDGEPVNRHKPSVDCLFHSAALLLGKHAVGVILTGMGTDGSHGLLDMRNAGAFTLAQDQETSTVYGMPRVAFEIGAVVKVMPLDLIAGGMLEACKLAKAS
ncbi:MAG: chemotaxis response regulator protein-glutamate methylesterase [Bdellovibrio sp.]|jgi:two-component system chemotaxis response regulator CheB